MSKVFESISAIVETITPELARLYLESNLNNRPVKPTVVARYMNEIKNGTWALTHQGIAFDEDGFLLDGQHRLMAIIKANVAIDCLVIRGINSQAQIAMDDHAKRTDADALSLHRKQPISKSIVAAVRAALEAMEASTNNRKSRSLLNGILDELSSGIAWLEIQDLRERGVGSAPVLGALLLAYFYVSDIDRLEEFVAQLSGREMVTEPTDKIAIQMREWLLRTNLLGGAARKEAFLKTQRAIVAHQNREMLSHVRAQQVFFKYPLEGNVR